MNWEKLTQKAREAVLDARDRGTKAGHPEITPEQIPTGYTWRQYQFHRSAITGQLTPSLSGLHYLLTNVAYIVYVAIGDDGRPTEVPPLLPTTDEERQRWEAGRQRRAERLTRKARGG